MLSIKIAVLISGRDFKIMNLHETNIFKVFQRISWPTISFLKQKLLNREASSIN